MVIFPEGHLSFRGVISFATFLFVKNTLQNVTFEVLPWWCFCHMRMEFRCRPGIFCGQKNLRRNRLRIAPCEALLPQSAASKLCAKYDCLVYYPWKQKWFQGMNTKKYILLSLHFSFENVISIRYWDQRGRLSWIPDNHLKLWCYLYIIIARLAP